MRIVPVSSDHDAEWRDLRGLFPVDAGAVRRGAAAPAEDAWCKNFDFLRLKDFALHLLDVRPGMAILDLGCAYGAQMIYAGLQGAAMSGIDLDPVRVAMARRKLTASGLSGDARVGDATALPFEDGRFDGVLSSDFHEHLSHGQQIAVFRESRRVLKPGGRLVLKTPNLNYLTLATWIKRLRALSKGRSPFGYVIAHTEGTQNPEHVGLTTRSRMSRQLEEAGFQNWQWHYAPQRRLGVSYVMDVASTETPFLRDWFCEDLFLVAYKPIASAYFPD